MTREEIEKEYDARLDNYRKSLDFFKEMVKDCYKDLKESKLVKIDQDCSFCVKEKESFVNKALKPKVDSKTKEPIEGTQKYENPFIDIQDIIRARIVVFYLSDVDKIAKRVKESLGGIEDNDFVNFDDYQKFGYQGRHLIVNINKALIPDELGLNKELIPSFFELQIKTLFQHAWSQAEHDLRYKEDEEHPLSFEQKRMLAFAAAQAWGTDKVFDSIYSDKL